MTGARGGFLRPRSAPDRQDRRLRGPARDRDPERGAALTTVVGARVIASAITLLAGFRAVSDDDFARVVIAESWARAPRWDASGTSWLPAPFWVSGFAMKITAPGLDAARVTSLALGVGASLAVYLAARWMGEGRAAAAAGTVAASVFSWSARLGVATVPELPAAALTILGLASLTTASAHRRVGGAAALLAATLCRYEAWPAAAMFAALCVLEARPREAPRMALAGAALLALAGPLSWLVSNRIHHGDALHFVARVTAYRQALGGPAAGGMERFLTYPSALVHEAPEVVALLTIALVLSVATRRRLPSPRAYARPVAIVTLQILALSLAMVKDTAPTHHPERAMLTAMILGAMAGGALLTRAVQALSRPAALAGAIAAALGFAAAASTTPRGDLAHRADEVAIGEAAARFVRPGERALVEVPDYGYLAIEAAFGRPLLEDRSIDPRDPRVASSFEPEGTPTGEPLDTGPFAARVASADATWVIARRSALALAALGAPVEARGGWGLFRVSHAGGAP